MRKSKKKLNIKKGYKIVSISSRTEKLRSYVLSALSGMDEGCIEYEQNSWVSQPLYCGPLAVFENLNHAVWFAENENLRGAHTSEMFALWSCDYIPSQERTLWMMHCPPFDRTRKVAYNSFLLPLGTRFARRVRLLNNITIFKPGA